MKKAVLTLGFGLLIPASHPILAQTATTPPLAPATKAASSGDPTGIFDFEINNGSGRPMTGRLAIRGTPDHYEGTIAPDGGEPFPLSSLGFEKDSVVFKIAPTGAPGELTFHLKFAGDSFGGRYDGFEAGQISGKKVR